MTPQEFITKWRNVEFKERTASQPHFNDLCRLLDIDDPVAAGPKGEWVTFEKRVQNQFWRRLGGCMAQEFLRMGIQRQAPKLAEDEILARLFKLNQERAKAEAKNAAKAKPKTKPKGKKNGK